MNQQHHHPPSHQPSSSGSFQASFHVPSTPKLHPALLSTSPASTASSALVPAMLIPRSRRELLPGSPEGLQLPHAMTCYGRNRWKLSSGYPLSTHKVEVSARMALCDTAQTHLLVSLLLHLWSGHPNYLSFPYTRYVHTSLLFLCLSGSSSSLFGQIPSILSRSSQMPKVWNRFQTSPSSKQNKLFLQHFMAWTKDSIGLGSAPSFQFHLRQGTQSFRILASLSIMWELSWLLLQHLTLVF